MASAAKLVSGRVDRGPSLNSERCRWAYVRFVPVKIWLNIGALVTAFVTDKPLLQLVKLSFVGPFVENQLRQLKAPAAANGDTADSGSAQCTKR